jgi:cytoskeletal protein RodZ
MVLLSRVLTGISTIIIIFLLISGIACNRDQSSNSQQTPSSDTASSETQSSPASVTQSSTASPEKQSSPTAAVSESSTAASDTQSSPDSMPKSSVATDITTTTTNSTTRTFAHTPAAKVGPENYTQVKIGMTSKQVIELMGKASKIREEHHATEWEYYLPQGGKFELHMQNDKVISTKRH